MTKVAETVAGLEMENHNLREAVEQLRQKLEKEPRRPKLCEDCKHFIAHYVFMPPDNYTRLCCGHCVFGRKIRTKRSGEDTCKDFEFGSIPR